MPPRKRKINYNCGKTKPGVQSSVKKQVNKNVESEIDERGSPSSSDSELKECTNLAIGNRNLKIIISRDPNSKEFMSKVADYFSSSDEENIIDEKSEKATCKKENNIQEPVELHNAMTNLEISNQKGRKNIRETRYSLRKSSGEKSHSTPSTEKKELNSTPGRYPRRRSSISQRNGFSTPRSSNKTPNNLNNQSSSISGRHLREINRVNYKEDSPVKQKTPSVKSQVETNLESVKNELTETPRKRGRPLGKATPSRNTLPSVDEECKENDSSCSDTSDGFTPKSKRKMSTRKSSRGRKSIAKRDDDFVYDSSPRKRKSTAATNLCSWQSTPSKRQTPGRKRAVTPEKSVATTPRKNIKATPKRSAITPRGRRTLTPSMHQRSVNVSKPKTNFQEFRARLHVSFVPKSLPCREVEFNNIFTFLQAKLTEETGGCIYISGVPGTGKTATVNEVISCLKKLESQGELPSFQFVDVNGMKMTEPRQAYVQIQKSLTGITCPWEEAHKCLHHRFTTTASRRNMTLLLIDELDLLCTKRQDVVYNLLDWPTYKSSHLVVITIANTMDLPERVMMGRVTSRLGLTRLTFQPYNHTQLKEIVKTRLKDSEAFKSEAIELVARKVASVSGDARRALDICRRATEIAESNKKDCVTMMDVTSALEEMIANPRVRAIKCCSTMERKFLEAVSSEITRIGVEQVTLKNIYKLFETICRIGGEQVPNITQVLEICRKLASWRLILWESGADLYQSILLNVSADDIFFSQQKIS